MQLQGRDLSKNMHGDDVAILHAELALLGREIPADEVEERLFSFATYEAVMAFQGEHGLLETSPAGVVDPPTAAALNGAVNERYPQAEHDTISARIAPLLGGASLEAMSQAELQQLAAQSHVELNQLVDLQRAMQLARTAGLPAAALYGLIRIGQLAQLNDLLNQDLPGWRDALLATVREHFIPVRVIEQLPQIMRRLTEQRMIRTPLAELVDALDLGVPKEDVQRALAFLAKPENGAIRTLLDIRRKGGTSKLVPQHGPLNKRPFQLIDAHADLSRLLPDPAINARLVAQGYEGVASIAAAPRGTFVGATTEQLGDFKAARMHVEARAYTDTFNNILVGGLTDPQIPDIIGKNIDPSIVKGLASAEDAVTAVSPLAYLADLLDYVLQHVKQAKNPIDVAFLRDTFYQPFDAFVVSKEAAEQQVRQVRLCVEVLRRYIAAKGVQVPPAAEQAYRMAAYQALLNKLGTSYEEIRRARRADAKTRKALAERLGIAPEHLDALLLASGGITEAQLEQLFGLADTTRADPLAAVAQPQLLTWRLEHLRSLWQAQDWPADPYTDDTIPIIDPDLIGPDDFRRPVRKAQASDPDTAFDLWYARRDWIDKERDRLASMKEPAGPQARFTALLKYMYQPETFWGGNVTIWASTTPVSDFDSLAAALARGSHAEIAAAAQRIRDDLRLTVESFSRLMELRTKDRLAEADRRNEPVTDTEWREVYSILVQAKKVALAQTWRTSEKTNGLQLDPQFFWIALREPKEGDWPPLPIAGQPLIDPELVKIDELPDSAAGQSARTFWAERRKYLEKLSAEVRGWRESEGFATMLWRALNTGQTAEAFRAEIDRLDRNLRDQVNVAQTIQEIETKLHITAESFSRLMTIKAKDANSDPKRMPTEAEYADVYRILTGARKRRVEYPKWVTDEQATGLSYWNLLKARLPRWCASAEARRAWQDALRARSSAPLIDPDIIGPGDFKRPTQSDQAFKLWQERRSQIDKRLSELQQTPKTQAGVDGALQASLGLPAADLLALEESRKQGQAIAARLEQLGLTTAAFAYLLRMRALLPDVIDSEWQDLCAILAQAEKCRLFGRWRRQEQQTQLLLGPDYFTKPSPEPAPKLPAWRASWEAHRSWQDTLQARIDQEQALIDGFRQAVSAAEEATLPLLRDALVQASCVPGNDLTAKAKWLTDNLLIDAQTGAGQLTTRVAQAIETLQVLLWSLRTGQIKDTYPELVLDAERFDEEWKWIGSFAPWRAAMFVFMYPDNLLLPTLRREQTPAFRTLVNALRGNRRLSPQGAQQVAQEYAAYLEDICNLHLEATCQARTKTKQGEKDLFYMFARGCAPNRVYWSAYDPGDKTGYGQTFWEAVPGFEDRVLLSIAGAVPFKVSAGDRYIFLFVRTRQKGEEKLCSLKYSLDRQGWIGEAQEIELPAQNHLDQPIQSATFGAVVAPQGFSYDSREQPPLLFVSWPHEEVYCCRLAEKDAEWTISNSAVVHTAPPATRKITYDNIRFALRVDRDVFCVISGDNTLYYDLFERGPTSYQVDKQVLQHYVPLRTHQIAGSFFTRLLCFGS